MLNKNIFIEIGDKMRDFPSETWEQNEIPTPRHCSIGTIYKI